MKEYDIIKAAVSADMPNLEAVRREIVAGKKRRRSPSVKWVGGIAAALVLAAGIYIASQQMPSPRLSGDQTADVGVGDPNGTGAAEQGGSSICGADIHVNKTTIRNNTAADVYAMWKNVDSDALPKEFGVLKSVEMDGFYLGKLEGFYGPDDPHLEWSPDNYTDLIGCKALYLPIEEGSENGGLRDISVSMSYQGALIGECIYVAPEYDEESYIGDTQVMIYADSDRYFASFQYGGAYFDVNTTGITEDELVLFINKLMK